MHNPIEFLNYRIEALEKELAKKEKVIKWYMYYESFADDQDATDYADNQEY